MDTLNTNNHIIWKEFNKYFFASLGSQWTKQCGELAKKFIHWCVLSFDPKTLCDFTTMNTKIKQNIIYIHLMWIVNDHIHTILQLIYYVLFNPIPTSHHMRLWKTISWNNSPWLYRYHGFNGDIFNKFQVFDGLICITWVLNLAIERA
jgi:hypothetical protein